MNNLSPLEINFLSIEERIQRALQNIHREHEKVTLIAVTKKQPITLVREYLTIIQKRGELPRIGENYVQEFAQKQPELKIPYEAHLIGPLQSNKVKDAVLLFDVIQSVHNQKILLAINAAAQKQSKIQKIFLQINISQDAAKSGFSPQDLIGVKEMCGGLTHINVVGLMTILAFDQSVDKTRQDFAQMRALRAHFPDKALELSMGMSDDFEVAIEEGATYVRIGTALFGQRE